MLPAYAMNVAHVLHRDRLSSSRIVGDRKHDQRNARASDPGDQTLQRRDIHVALERMFQAGLAAFGDDEVHGLGPHKLHVGAGSIEMRIVRNDVALFAGDVEQNALRCPSLMGRDDVLVVEDVLNGLTKVIKAASAGVALIAFHHARPLSRGHGTGAGVGEQIDQHVIGGQEKQIVVGGAQQLFALRARSPMNRFHALDSEGFDNGFHGHSDPLIGDRTAEPASVTPVTALETRTL